MEDKEKRLELASKLCAVAADLVGGVSARKVWWALHDVTREILTLCWKETNK